MDLAQTRRALCFLSYCCVFLTVPALLHQMPIPSSATGLILINPLKAGARFLPTGLSISTLPGSIWGDFGASCPAHNTAVLQASLPSSANYTVSTTVSGSFAAYGEQAGLVLWSSQRSWVKLVLECLKTGVTNVVLASSTTTEGPKVVAKQPVLFATAGEAVSAVMELTVEGNKVKARATVTPASADAAAAAAAAADTAATEAQAFDLGELDLPAADTDSAAVAAAPAAAVIDGEGKGEGEAQVQVFASEGGRFHAGVMAHGAPEGAGRSALFTDLTVATA